MSAAVAVTTIRSAGRADLSRDILMGMRVWRPGMPADLLKAIQALCPPKDGELEESQPFAFKAVEVKHATELLRSKLPDMHQDTYSYMSATYDYLFFVAGNPFLTLRGIESEDGKRRASEPLGVGVASLFMAKAFGVAWESIEHVRLKGRERPDFRCKGRMGRFVYEAKGTMREDRQNKHFKKGRGQKRNYRGAAKGKFVLSSFFQSTNQTPVSNMRVADPPVDFNIDAVFSEAAEKEFQRQHFVRAVAYAAGSAAAQSLTREPRGSYYWRRDEITNQADLKRMTIGGKNFYGREVDLRSEAERLANTLEPELEGLKVFRGLDARLLSEVPAFKEGVSPYARWEDESLVQAGEAFAYSKFSDGTILVLTSEERMA